MEERTTATQPTSSDPSRAPRTSVARPPSSLQKTADALFRGTAFAFAGALVLVLALIVLEILRKAQPAIGEFGLGFLSTETWDPNRDRYGIFPQILGTLYTALIALGLGGFLGVTTAIVLSQGFLPPKLEVVMKNIIELLAAIPSVVYGLWGIYVLVPTIKGPSLWLHEHLGFVPFFSTRLSGPGILPAALVLSIMILPTITAISREALAAVPARLHSASYGLGATKWETILQVTLPTAAGGIFGAIVLGFGRALGETMALAMLAGNTNKIGWSLFSPANTLAALLANQFPEAAGLEIGALMYAALVLLLISLAVNAAGSFIMMKATASLKGLR